MKISPREKEILYLVAFEKTTKEIAAQLYISTHTALSHRKNIMEKLEVKNTAGMVRRGFELGLLHLGRTGSILLFIFFIALNDSYAQVSNSEINMRAIATQYTWRAGGQEAGDEEIAFEIRTKEDSDNSATNLFSSGASGYITDCVTYSDDCDFACTYQFNKSLINLTESDEKKFDLSIQVWEDDGTIGCPYQSGTDDWVQSKSFIVDPITNEPTPSTYRLGNYSLYNGSSYHSNVFVYTAWRYTHGGTWNDPLDFGILDDGDNKSHQNSNRVVTGSLSAYSSNVEYDNKYGFREPNIQPEGNSSPDVFYKFEITGSAKKVTITTDHSATNFDTYLHLVKYYGNDDVEFIAHDNDGGSGSTSVIISNLCPGEYVAVVEGKHSANGEFELEISAEDLPITEISEGSVSVINNSSFCNGEELPSISSSQDAMASIDGLFRDEAGESFEGYEWQKKVGNNSWATLSNENDKDLSSTGDMGTADISFRRRAQYCGIYSDWSNEIVFEYNSGSVSPGSITLNGHDIIREGTDPGELINVESAVVDPLPLLYQWQKSSNNEASWQDISSANTANYDIETLDETTFFRRKAINGCIEDDLTESIKVEVLPADGTISGKVSAPPLGFGTGISGVEVCAIPQGPILGATTECDTTDNSGNYLITNLYYGPNTESYEIIPRLKDHKIRTSLNNSDSTLNRELSLNFKSATDVNFVDLTVYTVSGNVYHSFFDGNEQMTRRYGKGKVVIFLKDASGTETAQDTTDVNGNYSIVVPYPGEWTIRPELKDSITDVDVDPVEHSFMPSEQALSVTDNVNNVDFEDQTTMSISGFIGAGCNQHIANVGIRFAEDSSEGNFDVTIANNGENGMFDFILPARNYRVTIVEDSIELIDQDYELADIKNQYALFNFSANMTFADTSFILEYKAPLSLEITGMPTSLTCDGNAFVLLEEETIYSDFELTIYDGPIAKNCLLDTGYVDVTDEIGDRGSSTLPVSKGMVPLNLVAASPNIVAPYTKKMFLNAQSLNPLAAAASGSVEAIVLGEKPRESTFVTVSPEVPFLILHDPPGDQSYSYFLEDSTYQTAFRFYSKDRTDKGRWGAIKIGASFSHSFGLGQEIGFNSEIWGSIEGNYRASEENTSVHETTVSLQSLTEYQTSADDDPDLMGDNGDVFIGGALNFTYAQTDVIDFDEESCQIVTDVSILFDPDSLVTTFIKTTKGIENTIEELKKLRDLSHPDSALYFNNQINVWETTLENNRNRKLEVLQNPELKIGNFSTDGGAVLRQEVTATTTTINSLEMLMEIDKGWALEANIEIAGTGVSGGTWAQFKVEGGGSLDTTATKSITTGFTLADDDPNDKITVDVYEDPVYKTPIFHLVSGLTSCPYEGQYLPLDQFEVSYDSEFPPSVSNIDPLIGQTYRINLSNTGDFSRTYTVSNNASYNQDGAIVMIAGQAAGIPANVTLNPGQTRGVTITVDKAPSSEVFSYPNFRIDVNPQCSGEGDESLMESRFLSAYFTSDCSNITMREPTPGTIINSASNNMIDLWIADYDKTKLEQVILEYTPKGMGAWKASTSVVLQQSDLSDLNSGTIVQWNLAEIHDDGAYEIRLKVTCPSGVNYSLLTPIVIDRQSPEVFGIPSPIDDVYDITANDQISVSYNESIACNNASAWLIDIIKGDTVETSVTCFGNKVIVTPSIQLGSREPSAYRVILNGVTDIYANGAEVYRWVFVVGEFQFEQLSCYPELTISNNNENQNAISISTYSALTIISDGYIPGFGTTTYEAQQEINLIPGFEVEAGGELVAEIKVCGNND